MSEDILLADSNSTFPSAMDMCRICNLECILHCYKMLQVVCLVGGLEHFLFSVILGIIIPNDFHIFQMARYTTNQFVFDGMTVPARQTTRGAERVCGTWGGAVGEQTAWAVLQDASGHCVVILVDPFVHA